MKEPPTLLFRLLKDPDGKQHLGQQGSSFNVGSLACPLNKSPIILASMLKPLIGVWSPVILGLVGFFTLRTPGSTKCPKQWTPYCLYSSFWDIGTSFWTSEDIQPLGHTAISVPFRLSLWAVVTGPFDSGSLLWAAIWYMVYHL